MEEVTSMQLFINDKVISEHEYENWPLQKVIIGPNVEEICDSAFANCIFLNTVVITPNTKKIHKNAFGLSPYVNYKVIVKGGEPNEDLIKSLSHLPNVQIVSEYSNENQPMLARNTYEFQLQ